jgi:DNA-binding LytR/AlgR family response regulator
MDGMTAAEKIREKDSEVIIIFITNMPQYVMEGYKVDALDYVLKPLTYFALSQRIDRALSRVQNRRRKYMTISLRSGMKKLDISRICYIELQDHDAIFHTLDGTYITKESLKNLENTLKDELFFRCHKCFMVNLQYVDGIQDNDIYIGDNVIQVSRGRKKDFLDALNDYMNEVSK